MKKGLLSITVRKIQSGGEKFRPGTENRASNSWADINRKKAFKKKMIRLHRGERGVEKACNRCKSTIDSNRNPIVEKRRFLWERRWDRHCGSENE